MSTVINTSMADVIDGLLSLIRALSAVTGHIPPVEVFDGLPGPQVPDLFVQIGGVDPMTAEGTQDWASIGAPNGIAPSRDETYSINCYISSYCGGADAGNSGASNAQKTARDGAFAIYKAIETAVRNDPSLITTLGAPGLQTGWCSFAPTTILEQTTAEDDHASMGRRAVLAFQIEVYKRLRTSS